MLTCRNGTRRLTDGTAGLLWEDVYHTITWSVCATWEEAEADRRALLDGDPARREIKGSYIEERP